MTHPKDTQELTELIAKAKAIYDAMTPEQKVEHDRLQRESWVRGEMGMGDEGARSFPPAPTPPSPCTCGTIEDGISIEHIIRDSCPIHSKPSPLHAHSVKVGGAVKASGPAIRGAQSNLVEALAKAMTVRGAEPFIEDIDLAEAALIAQANEIWEEAAKICDKHAEPTGNEHAKRPPRNPSPFTEQALNATVTFKRRPTLLQRILGGRPMRRVEYAFTDRVTGKPVFRWKDSLGRYWLAEHAWALFRVLTSA